jgi:SAM-dependent methyltransferase
MMDAGSSCWHAYYSEVADAGNPWLDLSNPRVHAQSLVLCLEAAGPVRDCACLDLGCGYGLLAAALKALGARSVVGVDIVESMVERNRRAYPNLEWLQGNGADPAFIDALPSFERVFLVEVLQYLDLVAVLPRIWQHVFPGGRLVGMIPNAECPIVARSLLRFGERYRAARIEELATLAETFGDVACWSWRGVSFLSDQRIVPYRVGPWTTDLAIADPPNRLNVVFIKSD